MSNFNCQPPISTELKFEVLIVVAADVDVVVAVVENVHSMMS